MNRFLYLFFISLLCCISIDAISSTATAVKAPDLSISSNPAAVNITTGTGVAQQYIEKRLGIQNDHGIRIGGMIIGDINRLISGGNHHQPEKWTSDTLFLFDVSVDTEKLAGWKGGLFDIEFLQFNGQNANTQVGSVQGYNSLPGPRPLNRSQLYQLWYRQEFFDKKFILRVGKQVPTFEFNNVVRPVPLAESNLMIPAVTSVIYTPIFVNSSMIGVLPGYYNSVYGITMNITPIKEWYLTLGAYDGHLAQGQQTGLHDKPTFDGSYFYIGETGSAWLLGKNNMPGNIGAGLWYQSGLIKGFPHLTEHGASGFYFFGSQRLWYKNPGLDISGISFFYQFGVNNSDVLPMQKYMGAGLTGFALIPSRMDDTMGIGTALAWLNQKSFNRRTELIVQGYYQAKVISGIYLEPALSYIPTPGGGKNLDAAWAGTLRLIILF